MYSIGELANLSQVSIRTLHYYDEIDLLSPTTHTDSGHRRYDDASLEKLYHILFLKDLGFELEKIKAIVSDSNKNPYEILTMQMKLIEMEQKRLAEKRRR